MAPFDIAIDEPFRRAPNHVRRNGISRLVVALGAAPVMRTWHREWCRASKSIAPSPGCYRRTAISLRPGPCVRRARRSRAHACPRASTRGRRLDRRDPGHVDRVERDIVAAAKSDFHYFAGQVLADPLPQRNTLLVAAGDVDDPRQHSISVETHAAIIRRAGSVVIRIDAVCHGRAGSISVSDGARLAPRARVSPANEPACFATRPAPRAILLAGSRTPRCRGKTRPPAPDAGATHPPAPRRAWRSRPGSGCSGCPSGSSPGRTRSRRTHAPATTACTPG